MKSKTSKGIVLDRKKLNLGEPYEIQYLRKRCKKLIELCEDHLKAGANRNRVYFFKRGEKGIDVTSMDANTIIRIAKGCIKLSKRAK